MAIEHLIAALGASWFLSSREAKEERRQAQAYAAIAAQEQKKELSISEYKEKRGFNQVRQNQLVRMGTSLLLSDRLQFARILGRPCCETEVSVKRGVRAIAEKEGWSYYDENELYYDLEYCKIVGVPALSSLLITDYENKEAERRKKEKTWQQWAARHPQCFDADVSPEYYQTEEAFALVAKAEYYKWRRSCYNDYHVEAWRYETKAAYERALDEKRAAISAYSEIIERLGIKEGIALSMFVFRVDRMEALFNDRPDNVPGKLFLYLIYLNLCIPSSSRALNEHEIQNREILDRMAKQDGYDLNSILEEADHGTLLPNGCKIYENYYLSGAYILTKDRSVWALHPSAYYEREHGFSLTEFAANAGRNPGYYYTPPKKGAPRKAGV